VSVEEERKWERVLNERSEVTIDEAGEPVKQEVDVDAAIDALNKKPSFEDYNKASSNTRVTVSFVQSCTFDSTVFGVAKI